MRNTLQYKKTVLYDTAHYYKVFCNIVSYDKGATHSHRFLIVSRYANVFMHPVTDDEAPGYRSIVKRYMFLFLHIEYPKVSAIDFLSHHM